MRFNSVDDLLDYKKKLDKNVKEDMPVITVCRGTGCTAFGSEEVMEGLRKEISRKKLGSKIRVKRTGCHGFCEKGPIVLILPEEIFYQQVSKSDVEEIIRSVIKKTVVNRLLFFDVNLNNRAKHVMDIPFYNKQARHVLKNNGRIDPESIDDYILNGGYSALTKALKDLSPDGIIEEVKKSGLRGRGGAGFPTGLKWELSRKQKGDKKYIVCNADEGDPGAFMDRSVLEGNPHSVLEGMLVAGRAIDADEGYIYVRAEYPLAVQRLNIAISEAKKLGLVGESILGSNFSFDVKIKEGAGAFVCGEETALIASIEGKRGMPRPRPPFPAQSGLWGKPTCINNVETFANVPLIIISGGEEYSRLGTEKSKGTKIFSLTGKINNTGLVEVPIGTKLGDVIFEIGGGIANDRGFKAVQTGGPSGGCISGEYLNLPIDYETLAQVGSIMGSGGMIVLDDKTCMVDLTRYFLSFTQNESCGKCTPCRIGTKRCLEILEKITRGEGEEKDIDALLELSKTIKDTSLCGLGQTAPNPILSAIKYFRPEFEEHIRLKYCRSGSCKALFTAPCNNACPAGVNISGYVGLIRKGKFREALELISEAIPFPSICGRVCYHPCEEFCKRGDLDEPVAINTLKRFVSDMEGLKRLKVNVPLRGEKVAIVGGGPSGLTCAHNLALKGYRVTIFEALPLLSGMMGVGIPEYRLPRNILKKEINNILSLGIKVRLNKTLGKDFTLQDLFKQGYKAIYISIGMHKDRKLGIKGENLKGVMSSIKFLRDMNLKKKVKIGSRVVVVGGGNVAIDSARSALRVGAREVEIVYRRMQDQMPAHRWEIEEAEREGVNFRYLVSPSRLIGKGRVEGIECIRMELGNYEPTGRRKPVPVKGSEFIIEADTVITAIGQESEANTLLGKEGFMVDPYTLVTNHKGVFAGGDFRGGKAMVIEAIADGKKAAHSISLFLEGKEISPLLRQASKPILTGIEKEEPLNVHRCHLKSLEVKKRLKGFSEVESGISKEDALQEARRCLQCHLEG